MSVDIRLLTKNDTALMRSLLNLFGQVFDLPDVYERNQPDENYIIKRLNDCSFLALVAEVNGVLVGGLTAYELEKYEQQRSEIYVYDLAISLDYRRQGIATALIDKLKEIATDRGAYMIFVQADTAVEDEPAIALYSKFGQPIPILHFEIPLE